MKIPDSTISELNAQADLVSIIRRHTVLKPAGKEFRGCCPFHGEKTPSFFVNPHNNLYHCFGCGARGNAISFLMDYEKLTFIEAVKELAQKTGIELPKTDSRQFTYTRQIPPISSNPIHDNPAINNNAATPVKSTNPANSADSTNAALINSAQTHGNLYKLLNAVNAFYQNELQKNRHAMGYFLDRKLSPDTIARFELGFAPSAWQHLESAFPYDIEGLEMLGLVRHSQKGQRFSLLRDRVIFPIKNHQGQVVGFAGRTLSDDVQPKYINSSDSKVFQKSHILYGCFEARQARAEEFLLVEGYMDVIALYQAGIIGAVAPMGTAVNESQIAQLLKLSDTLTLSFDGDSAGQKAALRTLEVAMPVLNDGKQLRFLTLPDNHDPDSFIHSYGKEGMQIAINQATHLSDYLYSMLASNYDLSKTENKAAAMGYLKSLTAKLPKGSSLRWLLNSDIYQRLKGNNRPPSASAPSHKKISPNDQLLLCILYHPALISNDTLTQLYSAAGLDAIDKNFSQAGRIPPALPDWHDLNADGLNSVIATVRRLLPFFNTQNHNNRAIDAHAQMILAALSPNTLQNSLGKKWRDFLYTLTHNHIDNIELLFNELLCLIISATLKSEQKKSSDLALNALYKKRLMALESWDKLTIKSAIENQA